MWYYLLVTRYPVDRCYWVADIGNCVRIMKFNLVGVLVGYGLWAMGYGQSAGVERSQLP